MSETKIGGFEFEGDNGSGTLTFRLKIGDDQVAEADLTPEQAGTVAIGLLFAAARSAPDPEAFMEWLGPRMLPQLRR